MERFYRFTPIGYLRFLKTLLFFSYRIGGLLPRKSEELFLVHLPKRKVIKQAFLFCNKASSRKRQTHREVGVPSHGSEEIPDGRVTERREKRGGMGLFS
jgi:hypothetical protein